MRFMKKSLARFNYEQTRNKILEGKDLCGLRDKAIEGNPIDIKKYLEFILARYEQHIPSFDEAQIFQVEALDSLIEFAPAIKKWKAPEMSSFLKSKQCKSLTTALFEQKDQDALDALVDIRCNALRQLGNLKNDEKEKFNSETIALVKRFSQLSPENAKEFIISTYQKYPILIETDKHLSKATKKLLKKGNGEALPKARPLAKGIQFLKKIEADATPSEPQTSKKELIDPFLLGLIEERRTICKKLIDKKEYDKAADELVSLLASLDKTSSLFDQELKTVLAFAHKSKTASSLYALSALASQDDEAIKEFIKAERLKDTQKSDYNGHACKQALSRMEQLAGQGNKAAMAALSTHHLYLFLHDENHEVKNLTRAYKLILEVVPDTSSNEVPYGAFSPSDIEHVWGLKALNEGQFDLAKIWFSRGAHRGDEDSIYNLINLLIRENQENQALLVPALQLLRTHTLKEAQRSTSSPAAATKESQRFTDKLKLLYESRHELYLMPSDRQLLRRITEETLTDIVHQPTAQEKSLNNENLYLKSVILFEEGKVAESLKVAQEGSQRRDGMSMLWLRDLYLEGAQGVEKSLAEALRITQEFVEDSSQKNKRILGLDGFVQKGLRTLIEQEYAPAVYFSLRCLFSQNKTIDLTPTEIMAATKKVESKLASLERKQREAFYDYEIIRQGCSLASQMLNHDHSWKDGWNILGLVLSWSLNHLTHEGLDPHFDPKKLETLLYPFNFIRQTMSGPYVPGSPQIDSSYLKIALAQLPLTEIKHMIESPEFLNRFKHEKSLEVVCNFLHSLRQESTRRDSLQAFHEEDMRMRRKSAFDEQSTLLADIVHRNYVEAFLHAKTNQNQEAFERLRIAEHSLLTLAQSSNAYQCVDVVNTLKCIEQCNDELRNLIASNKTKSALLPILLNHKTLLSQLTKNVSSETATPSDTLTSDRIRENLLKTMIADELNMPEIPDITGLPGCISQ